MAADDVVQVTTTADDADALAAVARDAVAARLAACAQLEGPVTSVYWWQGALETVAEWRATLKTTRARADALEAFLVEHHPYDVPEVLRTPVIGGNAEYLAWVRAEATG
ncbi:divalent-cation tolerance protein CutA [Puerhibacterium puerhi]|uniref:divalent-cation tolerance protein CutA n=1 Tax=Puerhibacterium puerhi TaxID=2692623 RepID=UPI001357B6D2|nr:divalent-cation tolerance protein CutA [Puerhibacterium puerhi]